MWKCHHFTKEIANINNYNTLSCFSTNAFKTRPYVLTIWNVYRQTYRHYTIALTLSFLTPLSSRRLFENIVTKEEIAQNKQFLLLPQCFPLIHPIKEIFHFLTKYVQSRLLQNLRMRERVNKLLCNLTRSAKTIHVQSLFINYNIENSNTMN